MTDTTKKIIVGSIALIAIGGLGIALAYKRAQCKKRKHMSIQIV